MAVSTNRLLVASAMPTPMRRTGAAKRQLSALRAPNQRLYQPAIFPRNSGSYPPIGAQRADPISAVIPARGAGIHALGLEERKAWIPGPSPGMTEKTATAENIHKPQRLWTK